MSIKVALIGVGNCAKSLVEGINYYSQSKGAPVGLMHPKIGPFEVMDMTFVAAFDIDKRKVGLRLDEAVMVVPNRTVPLSEPLQCGVIVHRGPSLDSIIPELRNHFIHESDESPVDVAAELLRAGAEVYHGNIKLE